MTRAITLWQPWASLVAYGWKTHETRSWATGYRGRIAIHAARRPYDDIAPRVLQGAALCLGADVLARLPLGAVVATAEIRDCTRTERTAPAGLYDEAFGDWTAGRFAWRLEHVCRVQPILVKGRQRIFTLPRDVIEQLQAVGAL